MARIDKRSGAPETVENGPFSRQEEGRERFAPAQFASRHRMKGPGGGSSLSGVCQGDPVARGFLVCVAAMFPRADEPAGFLQVDRSRRAPGGESRLQAV